MGKGPEAHFQAFVEGVLDDLCGFHVYTLSQPQPWLGTPGLPDLLAIHTTEQLRLWIEIKAPDSSYGVTDHQKLFRDRVTEAGGRWYLVDSVDALETMLATYGWELELGYGEAVS